jgi:hypothetical protein
MDLQEEVAGYQHGELEADRKEESWLLRVSGLHAGIVGITTYT